MEKRRQVVVTIKYEYEGEEDTDKDIIATERDSWTSGEVGVDDIIASGDYEFGVAVVELADKEDADAD